VAGRLCQLRPSCHLFSFPHVALPPIVLHRHSTTPPQGMIHRSSSKSYNFFVSFRYLLVTVILQLEPTLTKSLQSPPPHKHIYTNTLSICSRILLVSKPRNLSSTFFQVLRRIWTHWAICNCGCFVPYKLCLTNKNGNKGVLVAVVSLNHIIIFKLMIMNDEVEGQWPRFPRQML
jgi:hypothetical protein